MEGRTLIRSLAEASGLPEEWVAHRLEQLLRDSNLDPSSVNLPELRQILAEFMQDVLLSAKSELGSAG